MTRDLYHVSASANRESILRHGLDSSRMGIASGIAGSRSPEADGVFLVEGLDGALWFAGFGQVRPVDIWLAEVNGLPLVETDSGDLLCSDTVPAARLTLVEADLDPNEAERRIGVGSDDLTGTVEITFTGYARGTENPQERPQ